jgi:hypothetical protein
VTAAAGAVTASKEEEGKEEEEGTAGIVNVLLAALKLRQAVGSVKVVPASWTLLPVAAERAAMSTAALTSRPTSRAAVGTMWVRFGKI